MAEEITNSVPRTALVVDDREQPRMLVKTILEDLGFEVTTFDNGYEACCAMRDNKYSLLVSDNQMGENRNWWGVKVIEKAQQYQTDIKTILMSGEIVKDHSADAFILKPFSISEIEDPVNKWFPRESAG